MEYVNINTLFGFENYNGYKIYKDGRIWSEKRNKFLNPSRNKDGYLCVTFSQAPYPNKIAYVHRLVALAFIPNPNNYKEINHIDENKANNNINNLEWCSREYNINYGTRNEKTHKKVYQISMIDNNIIKEYNSYTEAFKETGIRHISDCALGKRKSAGGYIWKYE